MSEGLDHELVMPTVSVRILDSNSRDHKNSFFIFSHDFSSRLKLLTSYTDGHHGIVILSGFEISPTSADLDFLLTVVDDVAVFTWRGKLLVSILIFNIDQISPSGSPVLKSRPRLPMATKALLPLENPRKLLPACQFWTGSPTATFAN